MQDEKLDDGSEWSAGERAALDRLAMEREPSAQLRARTVAALRDRGLLAATEVGRDRGAPKRSSRLVRELKWAMAASVVFVAGGVVGYRVAMRRQVARLDAGTARIAADVMPAASAAAPPNVDRHVVWF